MSQALSMAGLVVLGFALVWYFGRLLAMMDWDQVLEMLRDPLFLLTLLGVLLVVASYLI